MTLPETKNGEKRIVPLSTAAIRILERIPRRIDGKVWGVEPHSISQAFRKAVSRARNIYEKGCEEKGEKPDPFFLADLTFHDLRHAAASRLFEKGLNPMQVAAIYGTQDVTDAQTLYPPEGRGFGGVFEMSPSLQVVLD